LFYLSQDWGYYGEFTDVTIECTVQNMGSYSFWVESQSRNFPDAGTYAAYVKIVGDGDYEKNDKLFIAYVTVEKAYVNIYINAPTTMYTNETVWLNGSASPGDFQVQFRIENPMGCYPNPEVNGDQLTVGYNTCPYFYLVGYVDDWSGNYEISEAWTSIEIRQ
jgi:hypothetical protein